MKNHGGKELGLSSLLYLEAKAIQSQESSEYIST